MQQKTFIVPKFWGWFLKFATIFFGGMLVFSLLLPILEKDDEKSVISTMILGVTVIGFLFFMSIKTVKELPYATLVIDDEGIWYQHLGKASGLVPWSKIACLRGRQLSQRLELLDNSGNVIIKAEYQLENFTQLRDIIITKTSPNLPSLQQKVFVKGRALHALPLGITLLFLFISIYLWFCVKTPKLSILFIMLMSLCLWGYLTTVIKVSLNENHCVLSFPLHKKIIPFTAVKNIATTRQNANGNSFFQIGIFVEGKKRPYRLTRLGIDDMQLLVILRQAAGIE